MAACPPQYIEAPSRQPRPGGLFTAAIFPPAQGHLECGLEFEPDRCDGAWGYTHDACRGDSPADLTPSAGRDALVAANSFTVYAGFKCTLVGTSLANVEERAASALALVEQKAVERAFLTGEAGNTRFLAQGGATVLGGGAVSPARAIALLETHLACEYSGIGVIHAPVGLASPFPDGTKGDVNGGFTTSLGTRVVYGAGYSCGSVGPGGAAAAAGTAWVYATGAVYIWRGPVDFNPTPVQQAFDKQTNTVELIAHRTYVVAHECVLAAVLVTLP